MMSPKCFSFPFFHFLKYLRGVLTSTKQIMSTLEKKWPYLGHSMTRLRNFLKTGEVPLDTPTLRLMEKPCFDSLIRRFFFETKGSII